MSFRPMCPTGPVGFGSIGAAFALIFDPSSITEFRGAKKLLISNDLNNPVLLSWDGTNTHFRLKSSQDLVLDNAGDQMTFDRPLYCKHDGAAPTSGKITVLLISA